jgi:hypothetical protein
MIKTRRMRWTGHVARMKKRNTYRILEGRSEEERALGTPRRRWKDNIKMYLREIGWSCVCWVGLALDRDQWRGFNKMLRNSWVAERLAAFQGISSLE